MGVMSDIKWSSRLYGFHIYTICLPQIYLKSKFTWQFIKFSLFIFLILKFQCFCFALMSRHKPISEYLPYNIIKKLDYWSPRVYICET